jgi:uncharacterized protein
MKQAARAVVIVSMLLSTIVLSVGAAGDASPAQVANPSSTIFINEIHYDNTSTDAGEAVEVAGPAGTDLTGWSLVLYNGNGGVQYATLPLSGVLSDQSGGYGTQSTPAVGLQNGSPDGLALVDASSAVVQFLSYEGTFLAVDGPAAGLTSTDIGVSEAGSEPLGQSLQLTGTGLTYGDFTWAAPGASTFGAVNNGQAFGEPPPTATPTETPTEGPTETPTETPTPTLTPTEPPVEGPAPVINEFSASTAGTDVEYIEIFGEAATDFSAHTLLEIEGDSGTSVGTIDEVVAVGTTDAGGFWLGNLPANALENGTITLLLVRDFTGALNADLDTDNDGVLDSTPWAAMVDAVAVNDGGAGDRTYGAPALGPNYDGLSIFAPGGASRIPDGNDTDSPSDWARNDFDLAGIPGFTGTPVVGEALNTPGASNALFVPPPVLMACNGPLSTLEGFAASQGVSATDTDGTVINILINTIDPVPASGSITLGSLVPAAEVGGTATALVTVDAAVPAGSYAVQIVATNDDATPQTGTCSLSVNVVDVDILPIGTVQGAVADTADGRAHRSSYAPATGNGQGQTVVVQGVIYEKTLARTSSGASQYSFFLQNTAATADADPTTSDGIFVFTGGFVDLIGGYIPTVGDEVVISGRVSEFFNLTELSSASALLVVRSGVDLEAELAPFDAAPPDDFAEASRYWERREGMRARIVPGSVVLNGRNVFPSTMDGEVWLAHPDTEIAGRSGYERRSFRDPHPLDNDPALFDDGNGYRIVLGSLGIKAAAGDNNALIAPAGTFDEVENAPVGGVYFSFSKYQILIEQQLELEDGPDPADNAPPAAFDRDFAYSVATFNVENLYDYRDDPFDGCDFTGNSGCPGVNPPFDYVPASQAAYQTRLGQIAAQIVDEAHSPDLILVQEAEDQDICTDAGGFACGSTDDADGRPDTLQELAASIASMGGPAYQAAYDRDGADDRGIVSAFLYRTDRVELLPASADDPILGSAPTVDYRTAGFAYNADVQNPKVLNAPLPADVDRSTGTDGNSVFTRPAQVGLFRLWRDGVGTSIFVDVYALSNHFSSTPNARVGQRTEQALYNAAIVDALQTADPEALVVVGGDLNVYPRPDDPFTPGHPLYPSDQLGPLYDQGLVNLWDMLVAEVPSSAYSYVFEGQAQTLDQLFLTPSLLDELVTVRAAHINSDWPSDFDGDGARGTSDHDPQVAVVSLAPSLESLQALLEYFAANGAITGNNTVKNLMHHLESAGEALASGNQAQFEAQLQAFANQVMGFSPRFITPEAAEALVTEAEMLAE